MSMRILRGSCISSALLGVLAYGADAGSAPTQLYNKTITISWSNDVSEKSPDGKEQTVRSNNQRQIYVSTAGRLFSRTTRSVNRTSKTAEMGPGDTHNKEGLAREMQFQGNQLVGTAAQASGASRMTVDFDPGFRTCTASFLFGKQGGTPLRIKGVNGQTWDIISIKVASSSCSINDGNAFAGS